MIKAIVAAVPRNVVANEDEAFVKATHVKQRHIAVDGQNTLSLGIAAAERLLEQMDMDGKAITTIIFVTQSQHVRMPALACAVAHKIGANCAAFDINLACSGYVYGLVLASVFGGENTLLIAGDCVSQMVDPNEPGTANLFGDCVTATLLGRGRFISVQLGTDGSGFGALIADPLIRMDGPEVFSFTLRTVPDLVTQTTMNSPCDWYLFHQANGFILDHLIKKSKLTPAKCPQNIARYGNTSSASIPLLMADSAATKSLREKRNRVAMFGFGAGLSWGGVMLDVGPIKVLEVIEV